MQLVERHCKAEYVNKVKGLRGSIVGLDPKPSICLPFFVIFATGLDGRFREHDFSSLS